MTEVFKLDIESWFERLRDVPSPLPTSIPVKKKEAIHSLTERSHNEHSLSERSHNEHSLSERSHNEHSLSERSHNERSKEHSHRPRESEERRRIDAFYSSNVCVFCGRVEGGRELICGECVK